MQGAHADQELRLLDLAAGEAVAQLLLRRVAASGRVAPDLQDLHGHREGGDADVDGDPARDQEPADGRGDQ